MAQKNIPYRYNMKGSNQPMQFYYSNGRCVFFFLLDKLTQQQQWCWWWCVVVRLNVMRIPIYNTLMRLRKCAPRNPYFAKSIDVYLLCFVFVRGIHKIIYSAANSPTCGMGCERCYIYIFLQVSSHFFHV